MKISDRKIDPTKREKGAWISDIPEWGGLQLKVRGAGNSDWAKREQELIRKVPRALRINGLPKANQDHINNTVLFECCLLDWRGLEDDSGNPEPFSKELARKYLFEPEFEPFRDAVAWASQLVAEKGQAEIEEDAGN